jgi:hypothetical protein
MSFCIPLPSLEETFPKPTRKELHVCVMNRSTKLRVILMQGSCSAYGDPGAEDVKTLSSASP